MARVKARILYVRDSEGRVIVSIHDMRTPEERHDQKKAIEKLMVALGSSDPQLCTVGRVGFELLLPQHQQVLRTAAMKNLKLLEVLSRGRWGEVVSELSRMRINARQGESTDDYWNVAIALIAVKDVLERAQAPQENETVTTADATTK